MRDLPQLCDENRKQKQLFADLSIDNKMILPETLQK